ncbi:DUF6376 family protein [Paenibacillus ehimensis]|uniref:DUF6376 family protein n=1 Tax=Paenibacillus ehimensis TaxID=79264 RepID=A0ABT8VLI6_9BACL|nr:DUF6376 family protein [Paenibacillus ehimensis]MDO3681830.1 DUF6376 family protein [Paenibacillus ehimensis]MEC0213674.1 DUF6376 family protein [Paenibacillus ehimensis]
MKLKIMLLLVLAVGLLSGCGIVDKVNNSLNYVEEATNFINDTTRLAEQLPTLAGQAVTDPEARTTLKNELTGMKERIAKFNALQAPDFAKDVHKQLVGYNETLTKEINGYLEQINNGAIDWKAIENSQFIDTLNQVTQILDKVQRLTP